MKAKHQFPERTKVFRFSKWDNKGEISKLCHTSLQPIISGKCEGIELIIDQMLKQILDTVKPIPGIKDQLDRIVKDISTIKTTIQQLQLFR